MEFTISIIEINRRKKAFATLSASLLCGLFLSALILQYPLSLYVYLLVAGALTIINVMLFFLFDYMKRIKIRFTGQAMERITPKNTEIYPIDNITGVKIKRTSHTTIREIYIYCRGEKNVFISALDQFEAFLEHLQNTLSPDVTVKKIREVIDFDHPLFYALLGLPISFAGLWFTRSIMTIDYARMKILLLIISVYLLGVGLYFLWKKPIAKRFGDKKKYSDYLFGLFMGGFGAAFLIASFLLKV